MSIGGKREAADCETMEFDFDWEETASTWG